MCSLKGFSNYYLNRGRRDYYIVKRKSLFKQAQLLPDLLLDLEVRNRAADVLDNNKAKTATA